MLRTQTWRSRAPCAAPGAARGRVRRRIGTARDKIRTTAPARAAAAPIRPRYARHCRSLRPPCPARRDPAARPGVPRAPTRKPRRRRSPRRRSPRWCLAHAWQPRIRSTILQATPMERFMTKPYPCSWSGVFPAATTQFDQSMQVDLPATQRVQKALLDDGVHGLVLMGTVGEGNSLNAEEKRKVLKAAVEVTEGKAPVIVGVSEFTTATAASFARDAERLGASGLMVLPAMVYVPTAAELEYHFKTVAAASRLPIMLYNNPPSYRVNIDIATLARLADVPNIGANPRQTP